MSVENEGKGELPPPAGAPVIEARMPKPFYKKWWFFILLGVFGLALIYSAVTNEATNDATETTAEEVTPMPDLVGERFDVAISNLGQLDVAEDDVEIVGGGTFGILDESNWFVCEQQPGASQPLVAPFRLIVDRSCPETASTATPSESTPEESPTAEASSEPVPESPILFTASVQGNIDDFRKDLNDLRDAVTDNSALRIITNIAELSFNLGQIQSATPPAQIAAEWNVQLAELDSALTNLNTVVTTDGTSQDLKAAIKSTRSALNVLEGVLVELK